MCSDIVIDVRNIQKRYEIFDRPKDRLKQMVLPRLSRIFRRPPRQYFTEFWALRDITFSVRRGDTVGIIGRNGSGKSTLLQIISGTLNQTSGKVAARGRVAALLELGSGFNPEFTGRENVYLNGALYGLSEDEVDRRFADIEQFADIGDFIDQPVKTYSSGMMVRLAFAVIAHVDADVLIIDEALSVGDAIFTQKCMRFIREFQENGTLLFVSHDAAAIQNLCRTAIWLHQGEVVQQGKAKEVSDAYLEFSLQEIYGEKAKLKSVAPHKGRDLNYSVARPAPGGLSAEMEAPTEAFVPEYSSKASFSENISSAKGWTTEDAEINNVEFLDQTGESATVLSGGERVSLRISVFLRREFTRPIVGFLVRDRLGQDLFGENTLPFTSFHPVSGNEGDTIEAEFVFRLPMLPNGQYVIMASFAEGDLHSNVQHHYLHDAAVLTVSSEKIRWGLVGIEFENIRLASKK
ncbi:ABC transporter ATP-binding protein [Guyparkeria sp. SB14A]|uniref:ABC transporter ATP-binding protein n=1 Tax=Guyparkeria sp. SB14A TaxID=2571147 RepID=UPI001FFD4349|nr:ABC transporter ATP-binding protein [Guyparkeria sp. SB14A]